MSRLLAGPARRSALRVALLATALAAVALGVAGVVLDSQQRGSRTSDVDTQLSLLLAKLSHVAPDVQGDATAIAGRLQGDSSGATGGSIPSSKTAPTVPVDKPVTVVTDVWIVDRGGHVLASTQLAPQLPADIAAGMFPRTADLGGRPYRLDAQSVSGGRLIAATDIGAVVDGLAMPSSLVIGAGLLAAVFGVTLAIGLRAVAPVERARRAQLDFTADASHELRTPLSVIEAETALALRDPDAESPTAVVERIAAESRRLRGIVDGLLWLARYDAEPLPPSPALVDLVAAATGARERFSAVAQRAALRLRVERAGEDPAVVRAPEGWLDRLLGVLLDNACRVTPRGGEVVVRVGSAGAKVTLSVDDSGPGIPADERTRVLARFHRLDATGGGSGLGLAIADAVVRGTAGRWRIDTAPEGGASMGVSWPAAAAERRHRSRLRALVRRGHEGA
jgi:signal transduction histidine kinase